MTNNRQELAAKDYAAGLKYKEIAEKYGVSINTVKSWRSRNGWSRGAPTSKMGAPKNAKQVHPKKVPKAVIDTDEPDKHKLFAMYYLQRFNATWAYMQVYDVDANTAAVNGSRLLRNAKIASLIDQLKEEQMAELHVTNLDIMADLLKQAKSDLGDYIEYGTEEHTAYDDKTGKVIIDPETKKPLTYHSHHVRLKDQDKVDTSLLKSVRLDKGNVIVEMLDKQKAQTELLNRLPGLTRDLLAEKLRRARADADVAQAAARSVEAVENIGDDDDGFLTALDKSADDAWRDGDEAETKD